MAWPYAESYRMARQNAAGYTHTPDTLLTPLEIGPSRSSRSCTDRPRDPRIRSCYLPRVTMPFDPHTSGTLWEDRTRGRSIRSSAHTPRHSGSSLPSSRLNLARPVPVRAAAPWALHGGL